MSTVPENDVKRFHTGAIRSPDADSTRYDLISPMQRGTCSGPCTPRNCGRS